MSLNPRRLAGSAAIFLGVIAVGAWPSPRVALSFSAIYSALANPILTRITFGERGRARLATLPAISRGDSDNVTADTLLSLSVDGYRGSLPLGISLRRDVYLPLLLLVALLAAFPGLLIRQRARCLALAVPLTLAAGVAANALVAAWTFATQLKGVYPPRHASQRMVEFAYGALLSPPGNRFIAPLLVGAALIAWELLRRPGTAPRLVPR